MTEKYERVDFMSTYGMIPYSIWKSDDPKFSNPILKHLKERQGESTREILSRVLVGLVRIQPILQLQVTSIQNSVR